ncbi:MAG: Signal peptidase I T [Lentisphaerae bacterium ADurb.BinA184]|nr:MAG: Signal peptidase I T [Lentisphaerae bacterium ADurb.BinA184]
MADSTRARLERFFLPRLTWRYALRVAAVAATATLFFAFICRPMWIEGASMEPTYHDGGFVFCLLPRYRFADPATGDVVTVRLASSRVMLLKRVVAVAGDTIEFRNGVLIRNGQPVSEPYVRYRSAWQLGPRTVKPGHVYVVGDNRGMAVEAHVFGQTPLSRIGGAPLW